MSLLKNDISCFFFNSTSNTKKATSQNTFKLFIVVLQMEAYSCKQQHNGGNTDIIQKVAIESIFHQHKNIEK